MVGLTGTILYERQDPARTTLDLNDGVKIKLRHHDGFGIPEFQHAVVPSPGIHGDYWFGVKYPARTVTLDLVLYAASLSALQNLRAEVIDTLNPSVYTGILKVTQANGITRHLDCVLAESLPMPTNQHVGQRSMLLSVRFRTVGAPFFYDPIKKTHTVPPGSSAGNFMVGGFVFPFTLTQSGVYSEAVLAYAGHVPTPVEINLYGPGLDPILRHETLNRTISFLGSGLTLPPGGVLYVNTDPRARNVQVGALSAWPYLRESGFWWLQAGENRISFELGGTSPTTTLVMTYYDRYLGL
jgi:hypothetical protein